MDKNVINNLKSESRWLRLLFMVLFYVAAYITGLLILLVVIIQVVYGFVKGHPHGRLLDLTAGLNLYFFQVLQFIGYNSETKPYPFSDWPKSDEKAGNASDPEVK